MRFDHSKNKFKIKKAKSQVSKFRTVNWENFIFEFSEFNQDKSAIQFHYSYDDLAENNQDDSEA